MKLRTVLISFTCFSLLLSGCSSIPNPFSKDDQTEEQPSGQPSEDNQDENTKKDQNDQEQNPEDKEKEADKEPDLPSSEETVEVNADGEKIVTNVMDPLVLVNKERNLPADFVPETLTVPDIPFAFEGDHPKKQMQQVAAEAIEDMFDQADKDDIPLLAQSGYRSYSTQKAIFASNAESNGQEEANKYSARAGQSEHQTGLTMDVTSPEVSFQLIEEFGETTAGKWVKDNAHKYGFIIRYPKGKEGITGYQYEPWHLRYVGKEHAARIHEKNLTLEEYLGAPVEPVNSTE
ncbi:D-alanyl-D-alanine carboxypeptidase family protein [Pseudalkalibacillus sp. A8]|uniref:M15 family metallopeptidase n=1 Tax=Pseudalkalibacillus sp. A8 TaxID=3382641 RepID=UPI0038B54689